jgi:hypothetical protein
MGFISVEPKLEENNREWSVVSHEGGKCFLFVELSRKALRG